MTTSVCVQHLSLFVPCSHRYVPFRSATEPPVALIEDNVVAVVVTDTVYLVHKYLVERFAVGRAKLQYNDTFTVEAWGKTLVGIELMVPRPYAFGAFFLRELYGCCCNSCTSVSQREKRYVQEIIDYLDPGFSSVVS